MVLSKRLGAMVTLVLLLVLSLTLTPSSLLARGDGNDAIVAAAQHAIAAQPTALSSGGVRVNSDVTRVGDWALVSAALFPDLAQKEKPYGGLVLLAHRDTGGWRAALQGTADFKTWLVAAPEKLLTRQAKQYLAELGLPSEVSILAAENGQAMLSLPYRVGESWRLTGGPHGTNRNSIDLSNGYWPIAAANAGTVSIPCRNMVMITHSNGWQTSYYHMIRIDVRAGQTVRRGQLIGQAGSEIGCGGWSSGPHVHFSLLRNGSAFPIHGAYVGGYLVQATAGDYNGYMVRNGRTYPKGSRIYNDGAIGRGN